MPRAKQSARKGSSTKAPKKAESKIKEEKTPHDEDVATLPSENEGEFGESSTHPPRARARKSKRVPEESEGDQMQSDDVEVEGRAQAASQPEYVKRDPPAVQLQSTASPPVPTPTRTTPSRSPAQFAVPEPQSAAPLCDIDKLTKLACTYAWPIYKQPLARATLNPHVEREKALKRKLAAGRQPTGEDPNPHGRKKYWLEMPRGYLAMGGCERVAVWMGDDLNAAIYKWYDRRMEVGAKEGEGLAVNGKEKVKKTKGLRVAERPGQVDEDAFKAGRNYVSSDAVLQTRYGFIDSYLICTLLIPDSCFTERSFSDQTQRWRVFESTQRM